MARSDSVCAVSGTYRTADACSVVRELILGERAPRCPTCGGAVEWQLVRSNRRGWFDRPKSRPDPRRAAR
jgi:hypothetical protein